jgi:DNA polymerase III delta' subunit
MIERSRVPQTLLFAGPEGVGKNLAAILFAQALSCREPNNGDACGDCPACIQVRRKIYPDLLLVAAEKQQIKIDQVSKIQEFISFSPLVGKHRIVIIQDAHKLNLTAANALLKTLEEPTPEVIFILLSHRHNLLLPTILSRCLMLSFVSLPAAAVAAILKRLELDEEYGNIGESEIAEAAAWSGGSMGRALFFLVAENLSWCRDFIAKFSRLPQATLLIALDLSEAVVEFNEFEAVFFILRSFLHDTLLTVQGVDLRGAAELKIASPVWHAGVTAFASLGEVKILAIRQRLLEIERARGINVNLKLAFDALFTAIATGIF